MCQYCYNNLRKDATEFTRNRNALFAEEFGIDLEHADNAEYQLAKAGLIYSAKGLKIPSKAGGVAWDLNNYSYYENDGVSDTIHPSLWLNGKSSYVSGVFEVVKDAIYQVRGLDLSNLTIIKSEHGWIVQDVMTTVETSRKALELLSEALHEDIRSHVTAVIISHSHWDHFGGIKGVVDEERVGDPKDGKVPVYVPEGFDDECIKEYIFAGTAMDRRNDFQFARLVETDEKGVVSGGLGIDHPKGTASFITPTNRISSNGTVLIDGLEVEFQLTPGTEAPAEMNNYFPKYKALWIAENCCGTLHNLYPIRGAQLRDASGWAKYIQEAFLLFGEKAEVVFQSHHWPHFNTEKNPHAVREFLLNSAAIYRYIHDQTLHLANKGLTAKQIAKEIKLPDALAKNWFTRPYYGTIEINARAVFTKYLGFYNADPVDLDPLTEIEEAKLFVKYAGPIDKILERAETEFTEGNYRNTAYVTSKVVYADPDNIKARQLCADAFEQLGYQSESSIWRNAYLEGAHELRNGLPKRQNVGVKNRDMMLNMSPSYILEYLGIAVDGIKAADKDLKFNVIFIDSVTQEVEQKFYVHLYHGTLLSYADYQCGDSDVTEVKATKQVIFQLSENKFSEIKSEIETTDETALKELQDVLVDLSQTGNFTIIEP